MRGLEPLIDLLNGCNREEKETTGLVSMKVSTIAGAWAAAEEESKDSSTNGSTIGKSSVKWFGVLDISSTIVCKLLPMYKLSTLSFKFTKSGALATPFLQ